MKLSVLLLLISVCTLSAQTFPFMEAENLNEEALNVPEALNGKYSIVGLAYSKKSEQALKTWFDPAFNQFMRPPDKNNLFATDYDINLYFIPMFSGHKTVAYKSVMKKMQEGLDPELHPHILFYKGTIKEYKKALALKKDEPHFFLLNEEGHVVWRTSGYYSQNKMQEIVDHLDEALGDW